MEEFASSTSQNRDSESDWSDINSDQEDRSLRIDLKDDEEDTNIKLQHKNLHRKRSGFSATAGSSKKSKISKKNRKTMPRKRRAALKTITVPDEFKNSEELEMNMEKHTGKLNLNRTQTKNVIRQIVEDPTLLSMVKKMAGESSDEDIPTPEMRLTRTLAKNVAQEGGKLNWILEKIQETTPEKKKSKGKKAPQFGEVPELPSDDDDDEYDPTKDACDISDEESLASASDTGGTPLSSQPKSLSKNENNIFKKPHSDATSSSVVRSLDFDLVIDHSKDDDADNHGGLLKMTRSKASLKDITIEELDTKFIPPDITPDLYDNKFDENIMFLAGPLTTEEEDEQDPDFMCSADYLNEFDMDEFDEMKWNKSTKITQKENDQLLEEVFEAYDIDQKASQQTESKSTLNSSNKISQNQEFPKQPEDVQAYYWPPFKMNHEERSLIAEQMRQHIQLLSQMALLTSKDNQYGDLHQDCRKMLSDLISFSFTQQHSIYAQDNLFPSNQMLIDWDKSPYTPTEEVKSKKYILSEDLIQFIAQRPVFIYHKMLPICALKPRNLKLTEPEKPYFAEAEDNLIALGLEEFFGGTDRWKPNHNPKGLTEACTYIVSKTSMKGKSVKHIRYRIKNRKDKAKTKSENPIKFYFKYNYAPREAMKNMQPYNPSMILAPISADPNELPQFWREKLKKALPPLTTPPPAISVKMSDSRVPNFTITPLVSTPPPAISELSPNNHESMNLVDPSHLKKSRKILKLLPKQDSPAAELENSTTAIQNGGMTNDMEQCGLPHDDMPMILTPVKSTKVDQNQPAGEQPSSPKCILEDTNTTGVTNSELDPNTIITESIPSSDHQSNLNNQQQNQKSARKSCTKHQKEADEVSTLEPAEDQNSEQQQQLKHLSPNMQSSIVVVNEDQCYNQQQKSSTRKSKQQKEAEVTLQLLEPEAEEEEARRKQHEALEISMHAKEVLNFEQFQQFCKIVQDDVSSTKEKFMDLHSLSAGHMELQELLLDLLTASEALQVDVKIYQQYLTRDASKKFLRKVNKYLKSSPMIHAKFLKDINVVLSKTNVKTDDVIALGKNYFKTNKHLMDEFMTFVSGVTYPEGLLPEPEIIHLTDEEDEISPNPFDEKIDLTSTDDDLGGDNCPCGCHPDSADAGHCIHCSLKFINGKVYSREGKTLKPVKIQYSSSNVNKGKRNRKRRK